ncbi:MAG: DNA polymerase I [Candidatus Moranbacteria bacterium]|nr:DNA polymerase I [Candidatus Moranbacteria bacterium]
MKNKPKTVILLDGNAILHRAYHGLPPLTTKTGETVHAVYGFALTLFSVIEKFNPENIIATFDLPGGTFRDELYEEYKSHREAAPDDLYSQIPIIKEMVEAFGIPIYEKEGFEADDLVGTLSVQAKSKGYDVIIVTGDTDTLQLVDEQVKVFTMRKSIKDTVLYGPAEVEAKYGFLPSQLIEYKGLAGDSSDNIPGVKGVGAKTATAMIQKYGNIESIYSHLGDFKGKLLENLERDKEQAFLSRILGTIKTDVDIKLDEEAMKIHDYDRPRAETFLREYEFYSLLKRLPGEIAISHEEEVKKVTKKRKVKNIKTADEALILEDFSGTKIACEIETSEDSLFGPSLVALEMCTEKKEVYRIEINTETKSSLQKFFADTTIQTGWYDLKRALHALGKEEIVITNGVFDITLALYMVEVSTDGTLVGAGEAVLHETKESKSELVAELWKNLESKLDEVSSNQDKTKSIRTVFDGIEMPLIKVLYVMEKRGIILNQKSFASMSARLSTALEDLAKQIYMLAGKEFNINSPKQLAEVLFVDLKIPTDFIKKNKTGISTASSELQKLGEYPIAAKIESYRELFKLKSTYLDALPTLTDSDSRLHTTYQQTIAATGRLSSINPNLQNIPARSEWSEEIRRAFEATPGYTLVGADYSQIELRIMAHLSQDKALLESYRKNEDVHTITAATVYKVAPEEVTYDMRRQAKVFNFGIMYGMGAFGLAAAASITQAEAKEFIDTYFKTFSGVRTYIDQALKTAKETGYVETELGRRRHVPEIQSSNNQVMKAGERMAVNMPIQGLEADIVKLAMLKTMDLVEEFPEGEVYPVLQVHDELIFEVKEEKAEVFASRLKEVLESVYTISVPLTVEVSIGKNWGEI